ncbi:MAG: hypothetical protein Kow00122_17790 [Thermoleophilia bacterium]
MESFGTTTPDLLALRDYLKAQAVTHVAMESTGVYWKCLYYALEDEFELLLVNAAHIKHVPGRKTDTIDAAWIAHLLACGLLRASFVPPKPIRRLRDLTRYRQALIEERSRAVKGLHKVLEDAGVKLSLRGHRRHGSLRASHDARADRGPSRPRGAGRAGPVARRRMRLRVSSLRLSAGSRYSSPVVSMCQQVQRISWATARVAFLSPRRRASWR